MVGTVGIVAAAGWHGIAQLPPDMRAGAIFLAGALLALGALLAGQSATGGPATGRHNGRPPGGLR